MYTQTHLFQKRKTKKKRKNDVIKKNKQKRLSSFSKKGKQKKNKKQKMGRSPSYVAEAQKYCKNSSEMKKLFGKKACILRPSVPAHRPHINAIRKKAGLSPITNWASHIAANKAKKEKRQLYLLKRANAKYLAAQLTAILKSLNDSRVRANMKPVLQRSQYFVRVGRTRVKGFPTEAQANSKASVVSRRKRRSPSKKRKASSKK